MNRKELKKNGLKNFKRDYFKNILVVFIIGIIINSGYHFTSIIYTNNLNVEKTDNEIIKEGYQITNDIQNKITKINPVERSNYEIVNDLVDTLSNKISVGGHSNGVIGTLFNNVTQSNSIVFGFLNAINLSLLNNKVDIIYISLIGAIIILFLKIFFQDVFTIGYKRYFLEQRRYHTTIKKILFPFQVKKNFHLGIIIFLKNIYKFLWNLTIIFGPIKYYEYHMISYVLAENPNIKRKEAFILSKELMYGYKWKMFLLDISFMGWNILNLLTLGFLDIFFLKAYKESVYAEVYIKIRKDRINHLTYKELLNDKYLDVDTVSSTEYPMDKFSIPSKKFEIKFKKNYDVKYTVRNYILMFFTFAFIGWLWEVLIHIISEGKFINRGTMLGPWLPIYGFGGILILIILKPLRKRPVLFFISAMLLAGVMEYTTGWYLETFKNAKWWDYTGYFLNIQGRVCLEGLLVFGFGGAAVTYFIGPSLNELFDIIKPKFAIIICTVLIILYGIDFIYSYKHPNTGEGITEYKTISQTDKRII